MKKNLNKKAFSLVELMVIIGIIGIMSSVVIVSLQRGKVEKELETAAREVSAAIREAQNNALTGKSASSSDPICTQYDFTYYANANYSVGTVGGLGCPLVGYTLKNGVTFASSGSFSFSIPFGNISSGASIQLTKNSSSYYVCVSTGGAVTEQKGAC
jgi:type II secretory pathway pseudopilin PulG